MESTEHEDRDGSGRRHEPDRNVVTLRLTTDEGHVGIGDATLHGRELAGPLPQAERIGVDLVDAIPRRACEL